MHIIGIIILSIVDEGFIAIYTVVYGTIFKNMFIPLTVRPCLIKKRASRKKLMKTTYTAVTTDVGLFLETRLHQRLNKKIEIRPRRRRYN